MTCDYCKGLPRPSVGAGSCPHPDACADGARAYGLPPGRWPADDVQIAPGDHIPFMLSLDLLHRARMVRRLSGAPVLGAPSAMLMKSAAPGRLVRFTRELSRKIKRLKR